MRADALVDAGCGAALVLALFELSGRQRYVVVQRHVRVRTCEDLARELGVTRQAVSVCEQKALLNLRAALAPVREELAA